MLIEKLHGGQKDARDAVETSHELDAEHFVAIGDVAELIAFESLREVGDAEKERAIAERLVELLDRVSRFGV